MTFKDFKDCKTSDFIIDPKKYEIAYNPEGFEDDVHEQVLNGTVQIYALKAARAYIKDRDCEPEWVDVIIPTRENTGLYLIGSVGVGLSAHHFDTTHIKAYPDKMPVLLKMETIGRYTHIHKGMIEGVAYLYDEDIEDMSKATGHQKLAT